MLERKRRTWVMGLLTVLAVAVAIFTALSSSSQPTDEAALLGTSQATSGTSTTGQTMLATAALETLPVKGRAPNTDYAREQFGAGWASVGLCDMRQYILERDLTNAVLDEDECTVLSGSLADPYTGTTITFTRGTKTSSAVQIDHVVALSNAWQTGAQQLDEGRRAEFANDPLNLLAVDGPTNQKKSDADAATWLPPNKDYRCRYVARQIAVKQSYSLWVTQAEHDAMRRILIRCAEQILPLIEERR